MRKLLCSAFILIFLIANSQFVAPVSAQGTVLAFPGAEGFGANAKGGRGGQVFVVDTLSDDTNDGVTLRDCALASGPRICVFTIGGTITLNSDIDIVNPFLTIAGQTAQGGGITLKAANPNSTVHMQVRAPEVIIRYIRSRPGTREMNSRALSMNNGKTSQDAAVRNVVIDHNSFSWSGDEMTITWLATNHVSYQWNITAESLPPVNGDVGLKGPSFGEDGGGYDSVHHNLIAHHTQRLPQVSANTGPVDLVNNVIYNPGGQGSVVKNGTHANYVKNYIKTGPNSRLNAYIHDGGAKGPATGYYVEGNVIDGTIKEYSAVNRVTTRYVSDPIAESTAQTAYNEVLAKAGAYQGLDCNGNWVPRRDTVDTRIVQSVIDRTRGHNLDPNSTFQGLGFISSPSDVAGPGTDANGWPILAAGTACTDTDNDGMPDVWENLKFQSLSRTASGTDLHTTYTNIEMYINGASTGPAPTGGPTATPTRTPTPGSSSPTSVPPTATRTPTPPAHCVPLGNINCQGGVDLADLSLILGVFGTANATADLNNSGQVDLSDLSTLLSNFGKTGGPTSTPTRTPTPVGPTSIPTRTPTRTPTPAGPTATSTPTPPGGQVSTEANLKVAFIGDSGYGTNYDKVLTLIKNEPGGVDLVLQQGDFAYEYGTGETKFIDKINSTLGSSFPYLGSVGNHDDQTWGNITQPCTNQTSNLTYANFFRCRMQAIGSTPTFPTSAINEQTSETPFQGRYNTGVYATYSTVYKGLKMVFLGENEANDTYYNNFINQTLSNDNHIWKICSWHKTMAALTVGSHGDDMASYKQHQSCLNYGAIIASAHNHNYSRTKTLTQIANSTGGVSLAVDTDQHPLQTINGIPNVPHNQTSTTKNNVRVGPGKTFMFVSGAGGKSLYAQTWCTTTYPYGPESATQTNQGCTKYVHASAYTPSQSAIHGALFITFNVNGDPKKAHAYFKNINGVIIDEFDITAE